MNSKTYIKYTTLYMNGLLLLVLYIFDINSFITNNIHLLFLSLYAGYFLFFRILKRFVIYAVIWDRMHQNEEPPMIMNANTPAKPILIEMKSIEGNHDFQGNQAGESSYSELELSSNELSKISVDNMNMIKSKEKSEEKQELQNNVLNESNISNEELNIQDSVKQRIRKIMIKYFLYQ